MTRNQILIGWSLCLLVLTLVSAGCSSSGSNSNNFAMKGESATVAQQPTKGNETANQAAAQKISLEETGNNQLTVERKIIRNATLTLEADSPEEAGRKITSIAETKGGFVVTSDTQQRTSASNAATTTVSLIVRVPAAQFDQTLGEIRQTVSRVMQEKVAGQDVTEEFIDLDAGLKTKKALEAQFLEILKQAKSVEDALNVQTEIAKVRGDIEKLEGRRKFLENQTSLSTVTITIRTPEVFAASSTGFLHELGRAFSDGINSALWVILALIRVFLALLPVIILLGVPLWLLIRYLKHKIRRQKLAQQFAKEENTSPSQHSEKTNL